MADIAILVAEEYQRRVKSTARKTSGFGGGDHDQQLDCDLVSSVSVLAQTVPKKIGLKKMEFSKWVKEPKSQVGLAASDGFFSA